MRTIPQLIADNRKRKPELARTGSVRVVRGLKQADRIVPSAERHRVYPCNFKWEVQDERLKARFLARLRNKELTQKQIQWYLNRLTFRNIPVAAGF